MPVVSAEFIKQAKFLAEDAKARLQKDAEAQEKIATLKAKAEIVADTLVSTGIVNPNVKEAAIRSLSDHEETLEALNKVAQKVRAPSFGEVVKSAAYETGAEVMEEANTRFLQAIGA